MMISVAISTYNGEKYVKEQIDSILSQSQKPDEIIVMDDCSTDRTVEIIEEIFSQVNDIDCLVEVNEKNIGAVNSFNKSISKCTGNIIFTADQDDIWMQDKIKIMCQLFEDEQIVLAYSDAYVVNEKREIIHTSLCECVGRPRKVSSQSNFYNQALKGIFPHGCTIAFRKKFFDNVKPCKLLHDNWLPLCVPFFGKVDSIDQPLIEYRQHMNNASGGVDVKKSTKIKKLKLMMNKIKNTDYERWFGWSEATYDAWSTYYNKFEKKMDLETKQLISSRLIVLEVLMNLKNDHIFSNIKNLFSIRKHYYIYRGNIKSLMIDIIYCIIKNPIKCL